MSELHKPTKKTKSEVILLLLPSALLVVAVLMGVGKAIVTKMSKPPADETVGGTNVGVVTVATQPYSEAQVLPGRLIADRELAVSSEITGRIAAWNVEEGGRVEAGKPIATLDTQALDAQLAQLQASLASGNAQVTAQSEAVKVSKLNVVIAKRDAINAETNLRVAGGDERVAANELIRVDKLSKQGIRTEGDLDRAKNDAAKAKAMVAIAENAKAAALDRVTSSEMAVAQAEAALTAAKARVKELEAALKSVRVQLDKSIIRSPISGVLDKHLKQLGEVVNSGEVMAKVFDFEHVRVVINVADRFVPFLNDGNPVIKEYVDKYFFGAVQKLETTLKVHGLPKLGGGAGEDVDIPATIARIGQAADPLSNSFEVELRANNPAGIFKQGQLVKASITFLEYPAATVIPLTAVRVTDEGQRCMVAVLEDGVYRAVSRKIQVRSIKADSALVTGELAVGDLLVSSNVQELLEGEEISIVTKDGSPFQDEDADGGEQ